MKHALGLMGMIVAIMLFLSVSVGGAAQTMSDTRSRNSSQSKAWPSLMQAMGKMDAAMARVKPSGNDDADFVRLMLPHHEAAIDMAKSELLYGHDPQMRRLAQEIITDQKSEIELMNLWMKRHTSRSER